MGKKVTSIESPVEGMNMRNGVAIVPPRSRRLRPLSVSHRPDGKRDVERIAEAIEDSAAVSVSGEWHDRLLRGALQKPSIRHSANPAWRP
jgi:hypothetical protein